MGKGDLSLGSFELRVALAVADLGDDAYGTSIYAAVVDMGGPHVAIGAVYTTLMRLEEKGLLRSFMGEPTAERGGRAKRYYALQADGARALSKARGELASLDSIFSRLAPRLEGI